jgi:hypothetical protein
VPASSLSQKGAGRYATKNCREYSLLAGLNVMIERLKDGSEGLNHFGRDAVYLVAVI